MSYENEMTAHSTPVGAGDEQSSTKYLDTSIADDLSDFNSLELNCFDENYLHTVSMTELYDTVYENRPPIVDGLLYSGLYLFVGSPKIGKSFLMAQLAYHISTGTPIWNYKVNKGTVLYLALEDDYSRLQKRLYQMFGTDSADNLYLSVSASQLNDGLDKQLESFITKHADTKLIIIDTLQKVREVSSDYSYSNDYEIISRLKRFADNNKICMILVHHTRKQKSDDSFDMISGTNGLLGAADGAFVLQKEKRTANAATLEISGRDQQDQKLYLNRNPDSAMVGKGSVTHNSRSFSAENVDSERTHLNIDYCNEPIKKVYHEMFDEALKQYNDKQKRKDRKIPDYYKHIESGKQEKLFHEIIFQIGNKDDMSATGEHAELARKVLDEYYRGFQERNPYLRVFSAHLHMDEATPHIHIDFVPFTTGSKRGLETRVSLKQAMLNMGFKGEGRSDNELNRWILSEKKILAQIMERHGIEWEQKGTHEQHLSVLDYKKQERAKEVAELDREIEEKQLEVKGLKATVEKIEEAQEILGDVEKRLDEDPQLQLPEPQGLMTAKSCKKKFVDPVIKRLKNLVRTVLARSYQGWEDYHRINNLNGRLYSENKHLKSENSRLREINGLLRGQNKAYRLLEKVFGKRKLNEIIEQARGFKKSKQRDAR